MPPFDAAEVDAYLDRIEAGRPRAATVEALARLQLAHLRAVPFENLDIHLGNEIVLDPHAIHAKVVGRRRGGYCYELNSAFGRLLAAFGFHVAMVSARVVGDGGEPGPEFDHMALLVTVPDERHRYLVDVGFGDAFTRPIPVMDGREQADRDRHVRVTDRGGGVWSYEERPDGDRKLDEQVEWSTKYLFSLQGHPLDAFAPMNQHQQHAPDSHFRKQTVCSLLTVEGRITMSGGCLIETTIDGDRSEVTLSPDDRIRVLRERFGVEVDGDFVPPA